jgi:mono/diheme cytochrome c family protein
MVRTGPVTTHEIYIAIVCAALVVLSLVVAMVVPRRDPGFPGRNLLLFGLVVTLAVAGMLTTVELFGTEEEEAEAAEVTEGEPAAEPAAPVGDAAAGREVFSANCGTCHTLADAGTAGTVGPNLDQAQPAIDLVVDRVTNGFGAMPPFAGTLSEQQIQDVAAYVVESTSG